MAIDEQEKIARKKSTRQKRYDPLKKGAADHLKKFAFGSNGIDPSEMARGRPEGARNKFSRKFIEDFLVDWKDHGMQAMADCRKRDPASYLKVAASIIPKEFNVGTDNAALETWLESINDDELKKLINGLVAVGGASRTAERPAETSCQAGTGTEPDKLH